MATGHCGFLCAAARERKFRAQGRRHVELPEGAVLSSGGSGDVVPADRRLRMA